MGSNGTQDANGYISLGNVWLRSNVDFKVENDLEGCSQTHMRGKQPVRQRIYIGDQQFTHDFQFGATAPMLRFSIAVWVVSLAGVNSVVSVFDPFDAHCHYWAICCKMDSGSVCQLLILAILGRFVPLCLSVGSTMEGNHGPPPCSNEAGVCQVQQCCRVYVKDERSHKLQWKGGSRRRKGTPDLQRFHVCWERDFAHISKLSKLLKLESVITVGFLILPGDFLHILIT